MIFDPLYLFFLIPGLLLGIWAQIKLSHAYGKYSRVEVESGMTGAEAAREILDRSGLANVPVAEIPKLVAEEKIGHSLVVVALYYFDLWQRGIKKA